MPDPSNQSVRVSADGKFFRLGERKFFPKGVAYGPFRPNSQGEPFSSPEQTILDFQKIHALGANLIRVYHAPPQWVLDLAQNHGLRVFIDVPWTKQACFMDTEEGRQEARQAVYDAARNCASHPAVFAISVVNEIPADIARWSGPAEVAAFIDELVAIVKSINPDCLCTFGNYPPTEYLRPKEIDFWCFNVYLHRQRPFENYLSRIQTLADGKPLLLGEFGIDSIREGEERKCEILHWQIELACRGGVAGMVLYSYTDEWHKDGRDVVDWQFGLTTADRQLKPSYDAVRQAFTAAPYFRLNRYPLISVVVASYNGARTLKICLESLGKLNYPAYEVILVDDGSTDDTAEIAAHFPHVRYIKHATNLGLSVARNSGIAAAKGEIVAYTDSDCRADEDWLYYLASDLQRGEFAGIGGPNLLPADDSCVAAAVMASPGGPAHVLLTDRLAEHVPGCNMAFYKWVLDEIGGFDPVFRRAGDDVDICWRVQQAGYRVGFSPSGFVWHYRRSTARDYLRQQSGYGDAEALLIRKHPERFSSVGGGIWQGRIYSPCRLGVVFQQPRIYHGLFGSGFFQSLYAAQPEASVMFFTSLEYQALVVLPLFVLSAAFHFLLLLAGISLVLPLVLSATAGYQANLPRKKVRFWSRPLVAILFYLQPIVRGWARYQGRLNLHSKPLFAYENLDSLSARRKSILFEEVQYWAEQGVDRFGFLSRVLQRLEKQDWPHRLDPGWRGFDIEIAGDRWSRVQLITVAEACPGGKYLFRCRLRPEWTFLARTFFFSALGVELLAIGFWGVTPLWHWSILISLLVLAAWLRLQSNNLQRIVAVFLDEVAKELNLVKLESSPSRKPPGA